MRTTRRSSEVRQVELVDAALHVIATRGIAALTTRSVAEQVGLTTGAIFRHFATLEDLLEQVVARVEQVLSATYPPATLPPLERLARFIEARTEAVGDRLGIFRLVVSEQFLLALPARDSERLSACVRASRAFLVECLRGAQRDGSVRDDMAAEVLAPIVMGTIHMLVLSRANLPARTVDPDRVRDALFTLLEPVPTRKRKPT